jgi:hypothetical protein
VAREISTFSKATVTSTQMIANTLQQQSQEVTKQWELQSNK